LAFALYFRARPADAQHPAILVARPNHVGVFLPTRRAGAGGFLPIQSLLTI
jgi:hypothetical protein